MQYICISMSAGMLLVMFIFHDLVGSFFYFSFLRKKSSFFCYPSVGWQRWALIKKNYSWSCSCYPLCEIINDFIDSWWVHIFSFFLVNIVLETPKNCFDTCRDKADKLFCDKSQLRLCVCSMQVNVCGSEMTGGIAALLVLNVRWSQWMSTTPQCVRLLQLKERESSH